MTLGTWRAESYLSGTITVSDGKLQRTRYGVRSVGPHIGIHYHEDGRDARRTDAEVDRERGAVADLIVHRLNTGEMIGSLERTGEITGRSADGIAFTVIGPHVDRDPPNCKWDQDDSGNAKIARARLMDLVFGISGEEGQA